MDGTDTLLTLHCVAPGVAPGQGLNETIKSEGLARSQAALNAAIGHEYARLNSRYGLLTLVPASDDAWEGIQATCGAWVGVYLSADECRAARRYLVRRTRAVQAH